MAHVLQQLPGNQMALSSNPSIAKKNLKDILKSE
jgi:hypothetical protein